MSSWIGSFTEANPWPAVAAVVVLGLAALLVLARVVRAALAAGTSPRTPKGRPTAAQVVATIGALGATGVGANTAWRFAGEHLHISNLWERGGLFLVGEVMLFGLALMARQNLNDPKMRRTGLPGTLVWVLSGFLAVPAISESDSVAGAAWRIVLGPLGAALLWHLAMGIELRHGSDESVENTGFAAKLMRRLAQQILSWLGVAEQDVTAEELARERARSRAAELVDRLGALDDKKRTGRKGASLRRQLRTTLRKAGVAGDQERRQLLLDDLAVSSHAAALVELEHPSPWEDPAPAAAPNALYAVVRTYVAEHQAFPSTAMLQSLERALPPASSDDLEVELRRLTEGEDGPDDDGPRGPGGGAPRPEARERLLQKLGLPLDRPDEEVMADLGIWSEPKQQPELDPAVQQALASAPSDAARVRFAMQHLQSSVTGDVVRWLREYGYAVNRGSAHQVIGKQVEEQRRSNVTPLPRREV